MTVTPRASPAQRDAVPDRGRPLDVSSPAGTDILSVRSRRARRYPRRPAMAWRESTTWCRRACGQVDHRCAAAVLAWSERWWTRPNVVPRDQPHHIPQAKAVRDWTRSRTDDALFSGDRRRDDPEAAAVERRWATRPSRMGAISHRGGRGGRNGDQAASATTPRSTRGRSGRTTARPARCGPAGEHRRASAPGGCGHPQQAIDAEHGLAPADRPAVGGVDQGDRRHRRRRSATSRSGTSVGGRLGGRVSPAARSRSTHG